MRFVNGCDLRDIALSRPKTFVAKWLYATGVGFAIINLAALLKELGAEVIETGVS